MLCPNSPQSLPRPFGYLSDFDCRRIDDEAMAEAHKNIIFELYSICSLVSESTILTPVALLEFSS